MASFLKKTMLYLGLGPDDEYEFYSDTDGNTVEGPSVRGDRHESDTSERSRGMTAVRGTREPAVSATVTRVQPRGSGSEGVGAVRPFPSGPSSAAAVGLADSSEARPSARHSTSVVRPIPRDTNVKPHTVTPTSFNDAQQIADHYKNQQAVIINLSEADRDLRRRLIDFCSGLCYGLGGQMERVADHVYLLTPSNVEVSAEDRRRLERGED